MIIVVNWTKCWTRQRTQKPDNIVVDQRRSRSCCLCGSDQSNKLTVDCGSAEQSSSQLYWWCTRLVLYGGPWPGTNASQSRWHHTAHTQAAIIWTGLGTTVGRRTTSCLCLLICKFVPSACSWLRYSQSQSGGSIIPWLLFTNSC